MYVSDVEPYDLHLKSVVGHWTPGGWVSDGAISKCVDAGDPASDYSLEPQPNGGRVNLGAYGNTPEASGTLTLSGVIIMIR